MFEACPEAKAILDEFKSTASEALRAHEPFINYCATLMEQFDTAITELDDADTAHAILQRIGAQYKVDKMPDTFIIVISTLTLSPSKRTNSAVKLRKCASRSSGPWSRPSAIATRTACARSTRCSSTT
jgi:hypothetical protein